MKARGRVKLVVTLGAVLALGIWPALCALARKDKNDVQGTYRITVVVGSLAGGGTAQVSGQSVSLSATVSESSRGNGNGKGKGKGPKNKKGGSVSAASTAMKDNRFRATGDVAGEAVTFDGRVDLADAPGGVLKKPRIVATFTLSDGTRGRVVGYIEDAQP